jgi:hypothetical protein
MGKKPVPLEKATGRKMTTHEQDTELVPQYLQEMNKMKNNLVYLEKAKGRKRKMTAREQDAEIAPQYLQEMNKMKNNLVYLEKAKGRKMITREQAAEIAYQHLQRMDEILSQYLQEIDNKSLNQKNFIVSKIYRGNDLPFREPSISDWEKYDKDRCWIVYLRDPDECRGILKSSNIIIISMDSGKVLYYGTANDEG